MIGTRLSTALMRLAVGITVWLLAAPSLWAQGGQPAPAAPPEKGYTLCYIVVILAVALGLMLVCRSSNRSAEIKE